MNTGQESGLHYFEARYLSGARARLLSVDPKYVTPDSLSPAALRAFLSRPHELNLYAYTVKQSPRIQRSVGKDEGARNLQSQIALRQEEIRGYEQQIHRIYQFK